MSSVRRTIALSFLQNYTALAISFLSSIIIARILTPHDIGIFSIGVAVVGIAHMLRDFGVGQYIIQKKDLDDADIQAAFGLTLAVAWAMSLVIFVVAEQVAQFYGTPQIRNVMWLLAVNFLLIPFGSVTMALLRRRMEFGSLYWIRTSSALTHAAVAIFCAWLGYGYLSLAFASTMGIVATVCACILARPSGMPWMPGVEGLKRVLSFGGYVTGGRLATELASAFPELVIGKALDISSVGIFGRAMGLIDIFNRAFVSSIWGVMLPHFANVVRGEGSLKDSFLISVRHTTAIAWPFFTVMGLLSFPIVRVLYGDQWDASVPLVRILCFAGAAGSLFIGWGQLVTALGQPRTLAQIEIFGAVAKIAVVAMTAFFGLALLAVGLVLYQLLMDGVMFRSLNQLLALRLPETIQAVVKSVWLSAATAVGPVLALLTIDSSSFLTLAVALPLAAIGWIVALFALKHELAAELVRAITRLRIASRKGR